MLWGATTGVAQAQYFSACPDGVADYPDFLRPHLEQEQLIADVANPTRDFTTQDLFIIGGGMAEARWNRCDGQGRPATTGNGQKRVPNQPNMIRTSGPEATSCFGCHAGPRAGGSGDFVANTFNGTELLDPVTQSISPELSNERNTTGMFGSGYLELLAREMTAELWRQRDALAADGFSGTVDLDSGKGVSFTTRFVDGVVVEAWGIDTDLIVKPFGAGGTVASLRQFTVEAFNRHHGMQAEESYDLYLGDPDFDEDGVSRELTIGDITGVTLWQAMLDRPVQELPRDPAELAEVNAGQQLFDEVGCTSCHLATMTLQDREFCEPGPYNPPQIFGDQSLTVCTVLDWEPDDTRKTDDTDFLARPSKYPLVLPVLTDLKRHVMCDDPATVADPIRTLCDEQHDEHRPPIGNVPGRETFLTADLWQVAESTPFGHNGRFVSFSSIILAHAGEARASRDNYAALSPEDQLRVIRYLKSLKILDQVVRISDG